MMKRAFINSSGLLTAFGYVSSNGTDTAIEVAEDFALESGKWQYVSGVWQAVTPTLAQNSAALVLKIRTDASKIIGDAIGNFGNEYALAKTEADAFKAAGYLGTVPASVVSWAAPKGWTAQQACDDILATAANFLTAQNAIRANRLARAEAAKVCTTQAQIDTIAAQWDGFAVAIRAQLKA
jgi:hypothetical protein